MKSKKLDHETEDEPTVDISSLIDVCFLLLIYFIVTSTIAQQESDLILKLPVPEGEPAIVDAVMYSIDADGQIYQVADDGQRQPSISGRGFEDGSHRRPSDMPQLSAQVQAYSQMVGDRAMVSVLAHENAPAQYVIDFLNLLAKHEINNITFREMAASVN
jgi:biopolymer transport protein ExbD